MIVDDDAGMRNALEELLRAAGLEVTTYASGEDLLRATPRAGCVVLDLHLPGLSGFDVFEQLRSRPGAPPVVFITAHDDARTRARAASLGAAAYLPKPFPGRRLIEVLRTVLAGRPHES